MYLAAFLLGLTGSLHCLGMCAPLNVLMPQKNAGWTPFLTYRLSYNLGRTTTYVVMGGILGVVGNVLWFASVQQYVTIIVGIALIASVLFFDSKKLLNGSFKGIQPLQLKVKSAFAKWIGKDGAHNGFIVGIINGFLPCGLVYIAILGALVSTSVLDGMLYMFFFGIGTIPMLIFVALSATQIKINTRGWLFKIIPLLIGILFLIRGLNLGIPYLSPALVSHGAQEVATECVTP